MSSITTEHTLSGTLSSEVSFNGQIDVTKEYEKYEGDYEITPKAFEQQILETANKALTDNVVIKEIPCWETSNPSNGTTIYIAKEV